MVRPKQGYSDDDIYLEMAAYDEVPLSEEVCMCACVFVRMCVCLCVFVWISVHAASLPCRCCLSHAILTMPRRSSSTISTVRERQTN
jgi:hypothetical protein